MEVQTQRAQYQRLSSHFEACEELSRPDREQYLTKLAQSDPELEKDLRSLLRFHDDDAGPAIPAPAPVSESSRRRKSRLSPAILVLILGAACLGLILATQAWAVSRLEESLKQEMATNLKASVELRASHIRTWAASLKQNAEKILRDPVLVTHVETLLEVARQGETWEARRNLLTAHPSAAIVSERMLRAPPEMTDRGISVLSSSGVSVVSDYQPLLGIAISSAGADLLGRVNLGETIIVRPYPDRQYSGVMTPEFNNPVMFIASPIRDASGKVIAFGAFRFSPTHLYEIVTAASAEFVLFDSKSLVLNNLRGAADLQSWGLSSGPQTALRTYLRDPGMDLASGKRPDTPSVRWPTTVMCRSAVQGHDGMDATGQRDLRGQMVVAAWAWLPEWEMGIGGQMPLSRVLAPTAPVRAAFTALTGAFVILTAGLLVGTRFLQIRRRTSRDSLFGAYRLERSLGKGGMAEVFLARHSFLRRPAALKILSHPKPDDASVERFEREARLASRLAHPNTIQIFDFGETDDGRLYFAMEYVEGLTLAQFLALAGPPPVGRAVHLLRQIAGSLAEAHQMGLLHRDLKPSNIMISARGGIADIVKVLDFGIACSLTPGSDDFTGSISLIGTPAFLAPERIRFPQGLDRRSDIYSFGAVAFHLVTGRHVFEGTNTTELLYQVLGSPRPSPSQLRGEKLPDALEKLILDCLSVDPDQRPASVEEIKTVLDSLADVESWSPAEAQEWWTSNHLRVASFVHATTASGEAGYLARRAT